MGAMGHNSGKRDPMTPGCHHSVGLHEEGFLLWQLRNQRLSPKSTHQRQSPPHSMTAVTFCPLWHEAVSVHRCSHTFPSASTRESLAYQAVPPFPPCEDIISLEDQEQS